MIPSPSYAELYRLSLEAAGDRRALANLRRRIRRDRSLTDAERAWLLDAARYRPGCLPSPLTLDAGGEARPMTDDEIQVQLAER